MNTGPHDGSAALVRDGEIVVMVEQERLSARRHALGESPAGAVAACLRHADLTLSDITEVAVGWDVPLLSEIEGAEYDESAFRSWLFRGSEHGDEVRLRFVDHHLAHAASAFYTSGLTEAAVVVVDGRGESVSTTLAVAGRGGIETIATWGLESSLGHFYGWASEWTGLGLWGTGKLMGLAAYGRPDQPMPLVPAPGGFVMSASPPPESPVRFQFVLQRRELRNWFRRSNFPYEQGTGADVMAYAPFAASVQGALEETLLSLVSEVCRRTGLRNVVMAGGVALNCSANGVLLRSGVVDDLWVPPFPHDAGVSVGAALVANQAHQPDMRSPRLGSARLAPLPDFNIHAVDRDMPGVDAARLDDVGLAQEVARALADGMVLGWFQNRAEVGQRALGARSILCDPRRRASLSRVNDLKGREGWRPLAPVTTRDQFDQLFLDRESGLHQFMLAAAQTRGASRSRLPAAVHVDGTARPQVVDEDDGRYFEVVSAFHDLTGCPALVNTSLNFLGKPMIHSVEDALTALTTTDLDGLVVNDVFFRKTRTPPRSAPTLKGLSFTPWTNIARTATDA